VRVAVITGAFGLAGVILAGIFALLGDDDPGDPDPPTTTSQAPTIQPTSPSSTASSQPVDCRQEFEITAPRDGKKISASQGVTLEGAACESDLIWVLDYDPTDGSYFQVNSEPLQPLGGQWIQVDKPIGDPADEVGTVYTIVVIKATRACSEKLAAAQPDDEGTVWFNPLPPGCPALEDEANTRTVRVVNAGP
jgi:hypothetical protein